MNEVAKPVDDAKPGEVNKPIDIDVSAFEALDESDMRVILNGKETTWIWTFAGPGHERAVAQAARLARARLQDSREKEQAQVNAKKWKAPEETVDQVRARNIGYVVDRLLRWSPVRFNGEDFPYSPENARALLSDPRKASLLAQATDFLTDDASFTKRSVTT